MDHADEQALLAGTKAGVSDAALCTMHAANTDLQDVSETDLPQPEAQPHTVVLKCNEVITNTRRLAGSRSCLQEGEPTLCSQNLMWKQ